MPLYILPSHSTLLLHTASSCMTTPLSSFHRRSSHRNVIQSGIMDISYEIYYVLVCLFVSVFIALEGQALW